jgi:hypothetical protein
MMVITVTRRFDEAWAGRKSSNVLKTRKNVNHRSEKSSSLYKDTPLSSSKFDTRLWRFASPFAEGIIRLELGALSSDETVKEIWDSQGHFALSYVWGDPLETRTIEIDGHNLEITKSLYEFLKALTNTRYSNQWFWADQISINQNCTEERNHQVAVMSDIYSNAKCVLAYLGAEPTAPIDYRLLGDPDLTSIFYPFVQYLDDPSTFDTVKGVLDLLTRPYWNRLWVVQELALARDVRFICGQGSVLGAIELSHADIALMDSLFDAIERADWEARIALIGGAHAQAYIAEYNHGREPPGSLAEEILMEAGRDGRGTACLQSTLERHSFRLCSDPRDKIFGLQSLVKAEEQIPIDYRLSLHTIVLQTARSIITCQPDARFKRHDRLPLSRYFMLPVDPAWRLTNSFCERKIRSLRMLMGQLSDTPKQCHSLVCAMSLAHLITLIGCNISEIMPQVSVLRSWAHIWDQVSKFATTDKQKALALDLQSTAKEHHELVERLGIRFRENFEGQSTIWKAKQDHGPSPWDLCVDLENGILDMIARCACKHGFALYAGRFLYHPDEWPFQDEPVWTFQPEIDAQSPTKRWNWDGWFAESHEAT